MLQTSLVAADAATHDACRDQGSWRKTLDGVAKARALGLRVRVAMTETSARGGRMDGLVALLASFGIDACDLAVRPLGKRGFADMGAEVSAEILSPSSP